MVQSSDLLAAGTQLGDHGLDAILVDGAQRGVGNAQLHPTVFAGDPEAALVQVGQPAATGLVVGVRDVVAGLHTLSGDLTYTGHEGLRNRYLTARWPGRHRPSGASGATRCWRVLRHEKDRLVLRIASRRPGRPGRSWIEPRILPEKQHPAQVTRASEPWRGDRMYGTIAPFAPPHSRIRGIPRWQKSRPSTTRPPARPCRS